MPWHAEAVDQAGTGHALLALLRMNDGLLLSELERRGIDPAAVLKTLLAQFPGRAARQAEASAQLVAEAIAAGRMNRDALVRSVLADYWGIAGQVFRELASRSGAVGTAAAAGTGTAAGTGAAGADEPGKPLVQLDDTSDLTIYEQIVAQVQEAIATGRLAAGERLPTVRELADQLGIAPGTVARAYSELERQNIVVTQGVRGTRVAGRGRTSPDAGARPETLTGLLRPAAVAAFHLGATAGELRAALEDAMKDIFSGEVGPTR